MRGWAFFRELLGPPAITAVSHRPTARHPAPVLATLAAAALAEPPCGKIASEAKAAKVSGARGGWAAGAAQWRLASGGASGWVVRPPACRWLPTLWLLCSTTIQAVR